MELNFDLRTWYSVFTEYGAEFRSPSSILSLKPALGSVCSLANYSVAYEETQSNRVSDFRNFVCSLLPKAVLFDVYLPVIVLNFDIRARYSVHRWMWNWIAISELDNRYVRNKELRFTLIARYSVTTKYGAKFLSQSSIFGAQMNVELNGDFRARYSLPTLYGVEFRSQSSIFDVYRLCS